VSGNSNLGILECLMDNIDIEKMSEKLMMIYLLKIRGYERNLMLDLKKKKVTKLRKEGEEEEIEEHQESDEHLVDHGFNLFLVIE
jgi:hypothetical protein